MERACIRVRDHKQEVLYLLAEVDDGAGWLCEFNGKFLTAFVSNTTMALVENDEVLGSRHLGMRNPGLI